jgi:dTDP-4-dehydrorhamnose reductase
MKILIVGASGLVGGNIFNYLSSQTNWEVIGTYNNFKVDPFIFFDASESSSWSDKVLNTNWDVIVHTGALTHVDKCEENPELSYLLTVKSAENMSSFAEKIGAILIYISTDYIFDGECGPYIENEIPNPINIYGQHKLEAEKLITALLSNYLILRITNVYGNELRNKNFIARTVAQIKSNKELSITAPNDQYATPINAMDIAKAIFLLICDRKTGIYHLASTDFFNRVQLLQRINLHHNNILQIIPISTSQLKQVAKRPLIGGLIAKKFLDEYPDFHFSSVDDYLKSLME